MALSIVHRVAIPDTAHARRRGGDGRRRRRRRAPGRARALHAGLDARARISSASTPGTSRASRPRRPASRDEAPQERVARSRPAARQRVVVRYRVYANELTVRTSHVDETHAFLVGAALFLGVEGHLDARARVEIDAPAGLARRRRRCATSAGGVRGAGLRHARRLAHRDRHAPRGALRPCSAVPHRYSHLAGGRRRRTHASRSSSRTRRPSSSARRSLFGGRFPYDGYELLLHISPRVARRPRAPRQRGPRSRHPRASPRATATSTCSRSSRTRCSTRGT